MLITCSQCGTKNRVPDFRLGRPKCGRCGHVFANEVTERVEGEREAPKARPARTGKWTAFAVITTLSAVVGGAVVHFERSGPVDLSMYGVPVAEAGVTSVPRQDVKSCDHQLANGTVLKDAIGGAQKHGHVIDVMNGTEGDAILKLRRAGTGEAVFAVFVGKGASVQLKDIPDGEYRVQFAFGTVMDEGCQRFLDLADAKEFPGVETLHVRKTGNQIETAKLSFTLYAVTSGNVRPNVISAAAFNAD